ncbi:M64 family metallopeptidase [Streptomyces sp. NPDC017529]|uniref:M64 family metallopeptidase n=1 Tax=Streptomyces sp. NPDC017529 TaxID=3365000 RepID=UPI0037A88003
MHRPRRTPTPPGTSIRARIRQRSAARGRTAIRVAAAASGLALVGGMAVTAPAASASPSATPPPSPSRTQQVEYFTGPQGHPRHTTVPAATPKSLVSAHRARSAAELAADGEVTSLVRKGPTAKKVDVVFIGDGYTLAQQKGFHADAKAKWAQISAVQPYAANRALFNVWTVDAVSNQSGVSGDPAKNVVRDTALDSRFWCDDIERLLCVDTGKVESYASKAPDADLVIVLSNSAKYGGAGYNDITSPVGYDGIATASSDHRDSAQVAVHETGHSLGKLADEYVYDTNGAYSGPEPAAPNITKMSAAQLKAKKAKWYRDLGKESPDGGKVGAYEGGGYFPRGLNRPTKDSIMRTLGREFNLPGRQAMIEGFHRHTGRSAEPREPRTH